MFRFQNETSPSATAMLRSMLKAAGFTKAEYKDRNLRGYQHLTINLNGKNYALKMFLPADTRIKIMPRKPKRNTSDEEELPKGKRSKTSTNDAKINTKINHEPEPSDDEDILK
jgi:hypothetical protein